MSGPLEHGFDVSALRIDGIELRIEHDRMNGAVMVMCVMAVPDRDDRGRQTDIVFAQSVELDLWKRMDDAARRRMVRRALQGCLMHELDECLLVDGVRVFDPHKDEPK